MRIEQPGHFRGRLFREGLAVLRSLAIPLALIVGFCSGVSLLGVWLNLGMLPATPWRWAKAAAGGPFVLVVNGVAVFLASYVPKSMELREGRLILRGCGASPRVEAVELFSIRPDDLDSTIAWCAVVFRYAPRLKRRLWGMYVDDIPAAEAFRDEFLKRIPEERRSAVRSGVPS